ncbi:MAG: hypothetical protein ABI882_13310 [Acidobacteriota bacterium]
MLTISNGNGVGVGDGTGNFNHGTITLTNSTVSGNITIVVAGFAHGGGGIYNGSGKVTINRSTISNNGSSYYGGGIWNNGSAAVLALTGRTVSGNITGGYRGGGIVNVAGQTTLTNSTVIGNKSTNPRHESGLVLVS